MSIYALAVFLSSFANDFDTFLLFYSCLGGVGMGIVYFLPVLAGWSYFSHIRPIVAGSILSWFSFAAIGYGLYALHSLNPNNEKAPIRIKNGMITEKYFPVDSPQV
jgi:ABC-type Fe3+-siderophore transport system permease subunit